MARPADLVLPSKGAVDRAGRRLADACIGSANPIDGRVAINIDAFEGVEDFLATIEVIRPWRQAHAYPLRKASANLRSYVRNVPDAQVSQRLKKFATIVDKLARLERMKLSRMEDIGGCRVVVPDMAESRDLARRLKKNWTITRDRDYVLDPKPDGYRARHLVAIKDGRFIEVQIRTVLQDFWANTVERDGRRDGVGLKFGKGSAAVREQYRQISELMAAEERGEVLSVHLIRELQHAFGVARDL
ncbi:MAG: RelA/SpoT domain-containing protein [Patulibacter sp.]|nr:RelA/SpoT domain-containing protein [Patulibacter sp.]